MWKMARENLNTIFLEIVELTKFTFSRFILLRYYCTFILSKSYCTFALYTLVIISISCNYTMITDDYHGLLQTNIRTRAGGNQD